MDKRESQFSRAERVLRLLRCHRGPAMAITAGEIAMQLFGDRKLDRQVRLIIEELIKAGGHGEIIASTGGGEAFPSAPAGYFWATDPGQIRTYYEVLVSRDEELRKRMAAAWTALKRLREEQPQQATLEF